jgi:probable HAF family extracellular repeat protein
LLKEAHFVMRLLFCLFLASAAAFADPLYTVTALVSGPSVFLNPQSLTDTGRIVGTTSRTSPGDIFVYDQTGGLQTGIEPDAPFLPGTVTAARANNNNQVAGTAQTSSGVVHAFLINDFLFSGSHTIDLGTLGGGSSDTSQASAINDSGDVIGTSTIAGVTHAFLYSNGAMTDLGPNFSPAAINDNGQIAGKCTVGSGALHACLYNAGVLTDLGTVFGGQNSEANALNTHGQVVGDSGVSGGKLNSTSAFLYSGGPLIVITASTLPCPCFDSANAINDSGQVVGTANEPAAGFEDAFLYSNGATFNLNNLIASGCPQQFAGGCSGNYLQLGIAINAAGQIVAEGAVKGQFAIFLLTPVTGPSCQISGIVDGPPKQIQIAMQDTTSGLSSIVLTDSVNASVNIPVFPPASTDVVLVTATKIDQSLTSDVAFQVTDMAGRITSCDPVDFTIELSGMTARHVFRAVNPAEHYIEIKNGTPGVTQMTFLVNGHAFPVQDLKDGATYSLDIGSALRAATPASVAEESIARRRVAQTSNTVMLYASGQRGSSAYVLMGDASVLNSLAK